MAKRRPPSKGTCSLCDGVFAKGAMTRHLKTCIQKTREGETGKQSAPGRPVFHLLVEGRYRPEYWMHLEMATRAPLELLDQFLRDTWLECCGHMSAFMIEDVSYSADPLEVDDRFLDVPLAEALAPGVIFEHEYDFGSTTCLKGKVISEYESDIGAQEVRLLARNEPPALACSCCGKPAVSVCVQCVFGNVGWLCKSCAAEHKCGEEMLLPVVNSPRVGVCGYTG